MLVPPVEQCLILLKSMRPSDHEVLEAVGGGSSFGGGGGGASHIVLSGHAKRGLNKLVVATWCLQRVVHLKVSMLDWLCQDERGHFHEVLQEVEPQAVVSDVAVYKHKGFGGGCLENLFVWVLVPQALSRVRGRSSGAVR